LIPKYWEYREGKVIPWGMKLTDNGKVIPRDWLFDPTTNHILPSKLSFGTFLGLDRHYSFSDGLVFQYLYAHGTFSRQDGVLIKEMVEQYPSSRLQTILAAFHYFGRNGFEVDLGKTIHLLEKAVIDDNDARAYAFLAELYYKSSQGGVVLSNPKNIVAFYELAAKRGYPPAQSNLAVIYANGLLGVKKNDAEAYELYQKASSNGCFFASNQLGNAYVVGDLGVAKDLHSALVFYQKAVDQGSSDGMRNLGWMFENGLGVAIDNQLAMRYYQMAVDNGNNEAGAKLLALRDRMKG
jgi:TPR repeat protein